MANIIIPDGGTIGSTSDTDAISISSTGKVTTADSELNVKTTSHTFTVKGIDEVIYEDDGTTVVDADSGQFTVYNGSTKLFGITEHGYVLKPNQPAFTVYRLDTSADVDSYELASTSGTSGVLSDCVNNAERNNGNHWNGSTKRFTAPVSGNYFFSFNVAIAGRDGTIADNTVGYGFLVNGSKRSWTTYTSALSISQSTTAFTADGGYELGSPTMIAILSLSAGDYVKVGYENLSKNLNVRSFIFSGYLIG